MTATPTASQLPTCADRWTLDPALDMLNHGSFGACPAEVLALQADLRRELERRPVEFFEAQAPRLLDQSRGELAALLDADPEDLVFVNNATAGVNAVLRSLAWQSGDEIIVSDHAYNACRNVAEFIAARHGVRVVVAAVPLPVQSPQAVLDSLLACVSPRTRLVMVDHVTSPTAVRFPVAEIVAAFAARGVDALIDGAHAPGMWPVSLRQLGAAYYTATCHKWLCSPKGAGFLFVRRDRQEGIQPPVISHGYNMRRAGRTALHDAFDWTGTDDPTPWLCVGAAVRFLEGLLPGGIAALQQRNRALALAAQRLLCAELPVEPTCAEELVGAIAAVRLPDEAGRRQSGDGMPGFNHWLHAALRARHGIEAPVYFWPAAPHSILRVSAQAYNRIEQYERLAAAVRELLGTV